jgi:hypothetical protein
MAKKIISNQTMPYLDTGKHNKGKNSADFYMGARRSQI